MDLSKIVEMREIGLRKELEALEAAEAAATPEMSCITLKIPMRDGFGSKALVFKYHSSTKVVRRPLVALSFGGAFCFGSRFQLAPQSRAIAKATGAVVVNISYRLAPEHKFPTGPNDVWDSVKWLAENAACEAIGASSRLDSSSEADLLAPISL